MSRQEFEYVANVPVTDILLDIGNARIRAGADQSDCIARILRKEEQLLALMEDIARNGLTTMPILVAPGENGNWVVKDGNRRVTALKLLNSPALCVEDRLRTKIQVLSKKYANNFPSAVDVMSSNNPEAIIREVLARHSGANNGAGLLDWEAYLRTVYLLNNRHPAEYKRAGQYAFWAEKQGILVEDNFPITTLQRFFTTENLVMLGFNIANEELELNTSSEIAKKIAQKIITDFQTKYKNVDDIRNPEQAISYIETVRAAVGIVKPTNNASNTTAAQGRSSKTTPAPSPQSDTTPFEGKTTQYSDASETRIDDPKKSRPAPSPQAASWDRARLFQGRSPDLAIPAAEGKATTIVSEIRKLHVRETPLAAAVLLRALIEISDGYFRNMSRIPDQTKLGKNIAKSATVMRDAGKLTTSEFDVVNRLAQPGNADLLNIDMLQKIIHRDTHHVDYQFVNTFWDNIGCFVRACWRK